MQTIAIVLLVLASVLTVQRASRMGAAGARLRWLGLALALAALGVALWTVAQMIRDHRRSEPAVLPATSWAAPAGPGVSA